MAKQYWLQYHDFHKYGSPGFNGIDTRKDEFISRLNFGKDIILLILGVKPTKNNLRSCGLPLLIENGVDTKKTAYFLWEKFVAKKYERLAGEEFRYMIIGDENSCVGYQRNPVMFKSPEFYEFWGRHNRRGLICLSNYGVPFPELEEIGEGLVYRPSRVSNLPSLVSSGKVTVSQDVWRGLKFLQEKLPRNQLCNRSEAIKLLKQYGHQAAANWATSHPQDYLLAWKHGFEVQSEV